MGAYAQTPESYYNQTKLYDNQQSNQGMTISIDKFTYSTQDTINVIGHVLNYKQGSKISINILDSFKKTIDQIAVLATSSGNFNVIINLPQGTASGKYTMVGIYFGTGAKVSVTFNVIGNETPTSIVIPYGSNVAFNKLNFIPATFTVQTGIPITWTNNDNAVHIIASGKIGTENKIFADGTFDSGVISPGQTFTTSLFDAGIYTYFDKTSPWLVGKLIVVPYSGPASQKPVLPGNSANLPDNYLSIKTERHDLESRETTLFDDNIASVMKTWKQTSSNTITISDSNDSKVGTNSLMVQVETKNGSAAVLHDYSVNKLQDWSNYDHLNFWFKGQNTKKPIIVFLRTTPWKVLGSYNLIDNSTNWQKVEIPLYSTYTNMSNVQGLEFYFTKGVKEQFKIDDIQLISEGKKTLFNDDIASVFKTFKQTNANTISISTIEDAQVGTNSLQIQVETKNGIAAVLHDYSVNKLQDWSNYDHLNFWFKGQNTQKSFIIDLRDKSWKSAGDYNLIDDSTDWKQVQIPLSTYANIDMAKVRGFEILFNQGIIGEFLVDDIALSNNAIKPNLEINKGTYIYGETIFVSGNVQAQEGGAVGIRVISPINNIVTVNQVIPKPDNTFDFVLHVSGNQFNVGGIYEISAQYGHLEHKADTSFTVSIPQLAQSYKGFGIYMVNNSFYAILQTEGDFDINRIQAQQYSTIITNSTLSNVKKL